MVWVTAKTEVYLPGELILTLTGAEDFSGVSKETAEDFSGVSRGLGACALGLVETRSISIISWESLRSLTTSFLFPPPDVTEVLAGEILLLLLDNTNLLLTEDFDWSLLESLKLRSDPDVSKSGNSA